MKSETLTIQDPKLGPCEFSFAITRVAVAQICHSVGFKASQRSALETLTDVAARYIQALAKSAAASATSSGRTQSNLFDVVGAFEDLCSVQGFRSASNVNQTLLISSTLVDTMKFVKYTDEIPFAKPIRHHYQYKQSLSLRNSVNHKRSAGVNLHIPRWLPAIPPDTSTLKIDQKKEETQEEKRSGIDSDGNVDDACLVREKMVVEREKKAVGLPAKRPRVRFKMGVNVGAGEMKGEGFGVDSRNGVCRGGKRVSCQNRSDEDKQQQQQSSLNLKRPK